jgi:hypothetical protein
MNMTPAMVDAGVEALNRATTRYTRAPGNAERVNRLTVEDVVHAALAAAKVDLPDEARQLRPRRTHNSTNVYVLEGGNEDNDLWAERGETGALPPAKSPVAFDRSEDGHAIIRSTFVPNQQQRAAIAAGENVELVIFGEAQPPVMLLVTDVPIGAPPTAESTS